MANEEGRVAQSWKKYELKAILNIIDFISAIKPSTLNGHKMWPEVLGGVETPSITITELVDDARKWKEKVFIENMISFIGIRN